MIVLVLFLGLLEVGRAMLTLKISLVADLEWETCLALSLVAAQGELLCVKKAAIWVLDCVLRSKMPQRECIKKLFTTVLLPVPIAKVLVLEKTGKK